MPEDKVIEIDVSSGSTPAEEPNRGYGDILKDMEGDEPTEPTEEDETEPTEDSGDDDEPDDAGLPDETADEDADDVPELSAIILDPDADPAEKAKAWNNHWKGIQKREARVAEFETELRSLGSGDPETARELALNFLQQVADARGTTVEDFLGFTKTKESQESVTPGQVNEYGLELPPGYASQKEYELDQRLKRWEEAQENERKRAKAEAEHRAYVDSVADKTIRQADRTLHGFKVDRDMVAKAINAYPNVEPLKAVKALYVDDIVAHTTKMVRERSGKTGPELLPKAGSRGVAQKSAESKGYAEYLQEMRGK